MNDEELMNKGPVVEDDAVVKTTHKKADEDDRIEDIRVSDDVTPNFGYPTFNNSGSSETMGKIGWALTDIDDRLAKATPGAGSVTSDDITDATEIGRGILTAESEEAVRDLVDAASTKNVEDLGARIDREKQYRADGDAALEQKIADEVAARTEADNKLTEDLNNEITARTEADADLDARLTQEATDRADADTALGDRIDAEETARETAITDLTETIEENRTATEHSIATLTENLATESSDRAKADLELTSTLQGEIRDREAADTALGQRIDQEISDRTEADALKADKTYVDDELAKKLNADANAVSATRLETARNININGDATGTASFDGTADADITITLTNAGTTGRQLLKAETAGDANDVLGLLSVLDYKGQVASEIDLPEDAELGDVYNVSDTGMNYAWNGTSWDALGAVTTLTTLGVTATADELNYTDGVTAPIQTQLDAKQTKDDANAFETLVGETYATKTEMTDGLALKQDAATAFDGKYTSLTEVPTEFRPEHHTHVMADITDLDLSQFADYEIDMDHVIQIDSRFATTAIGMKAGVYLVTEGDDTPAEIQEWKGSVGFEGALTGYLHLFDYMPDGERHDHLALLMAAIRSADGSQYASGVFVFDGPQNKWKIQTSGMDQIRGLDAALALKADKTEIGDMLTKTEAASTYQVAGDYATKGELATKADATAIADMLTKTEAGDTYQPKGEYATTAQIADMETKAEAAEKFATIDHNHDISDIDGLQGALDAKADKTAIADMETKTEAASTYATKGELAAKQDAATAFDGKYTSLTEVPSQFTPAAHTHVIADVTGLQDALDAKADTSAIPAIPGNATTSQAGLMSGEDKTKLDGLNNYVLPEATADVLGGVKVGAGLQIQDGKLTTSTESKTFANPEVIGASETLDLSTATNGVYSINGGSITGLTGSNETAAALVINAGATHPSALAFDGAFATDKVLPVCQDGVTWFKLTAMDRAEFVPDPAGDTVTKEEFIALRDALVTAQIMKPQA